MTAPAVASDRRPRVRYTNRFTGVQTCQIVNVIRRSSREWSCSCCGGTIRHGGIHWQTLNLDGRICALCFILSLEVKSC